jgi:sulfur dioxygenase
MIFRQLFDAESSTFTYLVADEVTRKAALIDPVLEQIDRDLQLVQELELTLTHVLETHVHADHVTASGALRERVGCTTVGGTGGASCADLHVRRGDEIRIGGLVVRVLATPGHTDDSVSYLVGDRVFTGDALMIRANGRTDFQNGDAGQLFDSITGVLFALPDATLVYPAHDYKGRTVTTIGEERRHNPRLVGKSRQEFIALMQALNLPKPKKLELAVPANRGCGLPLLQDAQKTPVGARGRADYQNVRPELLARLSAGVRRIDLREPEEFAGPLGHLPGAELVPMRTLESAAKDWPKEGPLLLICRSGSRSTQAARLLAQKGFSRLYNLDGGMLGFRSLQHPPATHSA